MVVAVSSIEEVLGSVVGNDMSAGSTSVGGAGIEASCAELSRNSALSC